MKDLRSLNKVVKSHLDNEPNMSLILGNRDGTADLEVNLGDPFENLEAIRSEISILKESLTDHHTDRIGNAIDCNTQ